MSSLLCFFLFSALVAPISALKCRDENNKEVDWYIMYKLPHQKGAAPNRLVKHGLAYMYVTSENATAWSLSERSVHSQSTFLANTLKPIYDQSQSGNLMHVMYNDEPPNRSPNGGRGHTKGVVLGDENGGVWLVHSVPLFPPPADESYSYPETGCVYGQSVLCVSVDQESLNAIGNQLVYNEPQIYSSNLPVDLTYKYYNIKTLLAHRTVDQAPWSHTLPFRSASNFSFVSFAKTKNLQQDLYEALVAPGLNCSLLVETWLNGPGRMPSDCLQPHSVKNVVSVTVRGFEVEFKSALDHSKWAVGATVQDDWVCIGDINRAEHQLHRGGGTVCLKWKPAAKVFRAAIAGVEDCKKTKTPNKQC